MMISTNQCKHQHAWCEYDTAKTSGLSTNTILVVDDDISLSTLAHEVLQKNGFRVLLSHSGPEAMQLLQDFRPDAIMLDVNMPGMDGFEVCRQITQMFDQSPVPVMMVTGNDDLPSVKNSYLSGATDFVSKPVSWPIVIQRLGFMIRSFTTSRQLKDKETSLRSLVSALPDQILRVNAGLEILELEHQPAHGVQSTDKWLHAHSDVLLQHRETIAEVLSRGEMSVFDHELTHQGRSRKLEYRVVRESEDRLVVVIRDITDIERARKRLHQLSFYCRQTGLPNQYYLKEIFPSTTESIDAELGLIRIHLGELDILRNIIPEEQYQQIIANASERLQSYLRNQPGSERSKLHNLYKLDGSEFLLLYELAAVSASLDETIEQLGELMSRPFNTRHFEVRGNPAIGAIVAHSLDNINEAINKAGEARRVVVPTVTAGGHVYSPELTVESRRRMSMLSHLHKALEREELTLYYQPQVNLHTNRMTGVEALLRWHSEELGTVPPDQFIPLAEESGLIIPIGDFVIEEAIRQIGLWHRAGFDQFRMAVNFSALQLHKRNIVSFIERTLVHRDVEPRHLEIELTESALASDLHHTTRILNQLKELGTRTALDDFGTGFSSLSYLSILPFDQLKIDRSFIRPLNGDKSNSRLLDAIIAMGKSLDLEVLAEGVETESQKRYLVDNHCDAMQGYLYSRPRQAEELGKLFGKWQEPAETALH